MAEIDTEMLGDFLGEAWEQVEVLDREFVALEEDPGNWERVNTIFRVMHTLKGGAGFVGLEKLERMTHLAESLLSRIREGQLKVNLERTTLLLATADATKTILQHLQTNQSEGEASYASLLADLQVAAEAGSEDAGLTRKSEKDDLLDFQASLLAALDKAQPAPVVSPDEESTTETPAAEIDETVHPTNGTDNRIRVHVNLLDKLMNLVGELVLSRNQLLQVSGHLESSALTSACQRINLVTSELQVNIMQTRMQPISTLLSRFPRMVRDLCQMTGKEARFTMEGQETGLDRTVLDAIKDPLTHILRNSIDHGLEGPELRIQQGKNPKGHIHVRAYHDGGQVTIEVSDDGAGIDLVRVRAKAVRQRLLTPQEAERLSERDTLHLIFKPGFSTVEQITTLSGRGVGMDVVRSSVETIGGSVDLSSQAGQGATVKLRLPLTLAIIPALLVTIGADRYAIPQASLQELVRLEGAQALNSIETLYGAEVYRLRGQLLPLLRLRNILGLPQEISDCVNIVVVSAEGTPFGLIVDGFCDTEEIVVKPLARELKQLQIFAGATIMGDGRVSLIIDVGGVARKSRLDLEKIAQADKRDLRSQATANRQSLLLFRLGNNEPYAIPLNLLSRLEEFPAGQIETVRGTPVIQYRGRLLPLINMADQYGCSHDHRLETLPVLVFSHQGNDLGMIVGEIIDVVEEELSLQVGTAGFGTLGVGIISGRATTVVDLHSLIQSAQPEWLQPRNGNQLAHQSKQPRRRVLVVDDSDFGAALTTSYLQAYGMSVQHCKDPGSLVDRLSRDDFDNVIVEAGCQGASQILQALTSTSSTYRDRILTTSQRGSLRIAGVATVDPFGREQLLEAVSQLTMVSS